MITFIFGSWLSREIRNCRQVRISAPVGLFSGGTQRTALVIIASFSRSPSSGRALNVPTENPYFASEE